MRSNRPAPSAQWQAWLVLAGLFIAMMAYATSQLARQPLWRSVWLATAAAGFIAALGGGVAILARRARAKTGLSPEGNGRRRAYYLAVIAMLGLAFVGAMLPFPAGLDWAATALPLILIGGATWAAMKLLRSAPPGEFARAQKAYAEGRADEALGALKDMVEQRPDFYGAYQLLAMIRRERGEYAQAHQAARQLIALQPAMYHGHAEEGLTWLAQGNPRAAIAPLARAAEIAPRLATAHFNLGLALAESAEYGGGESAASAGPLDGVGRGAIDRAQNATYRAPSSARRRHRPVAPPSAPAGANPGSAGPADAEPYPARAVAALRQALNLGLRDDPTQLIARYYLARALRAAGQPEAAEKERRALKRNRAALRRWRDELADDPRPAHQRAEDQRLINEIEKEMG